MFQIRKAERARSKARITLAGPSKSGKTYGALLLASGMGEKIAMIDTENGQGEIYSDEFNYDVLSLKPPFTVPRYMEALKALSAYDVIIIDSMSHAWFAEGGLLDKTDKATQSSASKNSYFAWSASTQEYNQLIQAIQQCPAHIIGTLRTKTEYSIENDNGKLTPKKIGVKPIMRADFEYEFTINIDVDLNHAIALQVRAGKTLGLAPFYKELTPQLGQQISDWFNTGRKDYTIEFETLKKSIRDNPLQDLTPHKAILATLKEQEPDTHSKVMTYIEAKKKEASDVNVS